GHGRIVPCRVSGGQPRRVVVLERVVQVVGVLTPQEAVGVVVVIGHSVVELVSPGQQTLAWIVSHQLVVGAVLRRVVRRRARVASVVLIGGFLVLGGGLARKIRVRGVGPARTCADPIGARPPPVTRVKGAVSGRLKPVARNHHIVVSIVLRL